MQSTTNVRNVRVLVVVVGNPAVNLNASTHQQKVRDVRVVVAVVGHPASKFKFISPPPMSEMSGS
jgi:hypothetical protein